MRKLRDVTTIGFALFAMFFGAGNLLLPSFIGLQIGDHVKIISPKKVTILGKQTSPGSSLSHSASVVQTVSL